MSGCGFAGEITGRVHFSGRLWLCWNRDEKSQKGHKQTGQAISPHRLQPFAFKVKTGSQTVNQGDRKSVGIKLRSRGGNTVAVRPRPLAPVVKSRGYARQGWHAHSSGSKIYNTIKKFYTYGSRGNILFFKLFTKTAIVSLEKKTNCSQLFLQVVFFTNRNCEINIRKNKELETRRFLSYLACLLHN